MNTNTEGPTPDKSSIRWTIKMYYGFVSDFYYPDSGAEDLVAWGEDLTTVITQTLEKQGNMSEASVYGTDDAKGLVREWSFVKK